MATGSQLFYSKPMNQYQKLLEPYLASPNLRENGDQDMYCPLHEDKRRSAVVNFREGIWNCMAECGGGTIKDLMAVRSDWVDPPTAGADYSSPDSPRTASKALRHPLPDPSRLSGFSNALGLARNEDSYDFLIDRRGFTTETIQRYGLGWNGRKYVLPIYDENGSLVNVRYYQPDGKPKWMNEKGHGSPARLFPCDIILGNENLFWVEGEFDAMLTNQFGIPAFTATGGAKIVWQPEWDELLSGKHITLCFDRDKDGQAAIKRVLPKLRTIAESIAICSLPYPITAKAGKDITDFWLEDGTTDKLYDFCKSDGKEQAKYNPLDYKALRRKGMRGRPVAIQGTVASVEGPHLLMPESIEATCNVDWKPVECSVCPMSKRSGRHKEHIAPEDDLQLRLIQNTKLEQVRNLLTQRMRIPKGCPKVNVDWESRSAWHGEIRNGSNAAADTMQVILFEENAPEMGTTRSLKGQLKHKGGQSSIFLSAESERVDTELDKFQLSPAQVWGIRNMFEEHLPASDPRRQLDRIAEINEDYVTRRFGQRWLHICADLVYHSIIQFSFNEELVYRGWLEALAVGETRVGKSSTLKALSEWYERGEIVPCEKISIAGLVSTSEKRGTRGDQWVARVGKLPLCDRKLIVLDEAQGLSPEDIGKLSDARSAGIIKVTQAANLETVARVRLIWLANPRSDSQRGITALTKMMGKTEDLARIDLPLYLVDTMSVDEEYRRDNPPTNENPLKQHLMLALVDWAWSRKDEDVIFRQQTVALINERGDELAMKYKSKVPLMPKNEARVRVARLAAAVAARLFSTDTQGRQVIVLPKHVNAACWVYANLLKDKDLGYYIVTRSDKLMDEAIDRNSIELRSFLKDNRTAANVVALKEVPSRLVAQIMPHDAEYFLNKMLDMRAMVITSEGVYQVNDWAQAIAQEVL